MSEVQELISFAPQSFIEAVMSTMDKHHLRPDQSMYKLIDALRKDGSLWCADYIYMRLSRDWNLTLSVWIEPGLKAMGLDTETILREGLPK